MTSRTTTTMRGTEVRLAGLGHAVAALAMVVWPLVAAIKHRRVLTDLADLDDRMLADIGLTRTDLCDAYAEPLWREPTSLLARRAADRYTTADGPRTP